jgi:hypothetical protein
MFVGFIAVRRRRGALACLTFTRCLTVGWIVLYAAGGQGWIDVSGLAPVAIQLVGGVPTVRISYSTSDRPQRQDR